MSFGSKLPNQLRAHHYLSQGVKDVLVFDPTSLLVLHARRDGTTRSTSPQAVELECGCSIVV